MGYNADMSKRKPPICTLAKRLGDHLTQLRAGRYLEDFCVEVGLSKSTLARVEQGTQNLTLKTLQSICDHLDCDIADLFPGKKRSSIDRSDKAEE